ncbi:MAG: esterase/lipase family protein [Solirubrobacterales bacterium]
MGRKWIGLFLVAVMLVSSVCVLPPASAQAAVPRLNNYPIVLVHGFIGWGRNEVLGYKYWGGFGDLQEDLNRAGYTCRTAAVGPVSSSWDRACELYAQIVGTTTDYGKAHSDKYGHGRYGRTYTEPLVPGWGQLDANGKLQKIHLITHSHGGQTGRMLIYLLENGDPDEVVKTPAGELSPLFEGGKDWVASQTLVTAPCDGTTLATRVEQIIPVAQQIFGLVAAALGVTGQQLYDFKLDQWGLKRNPGENITSYASRVWSSSIWYKTEDISSWNLSPEGSRQFNGLYPDSPGVYYFTVAGEETYRSLFTGKQVPEIGMNVGFSAFAFLMGSYTQDASGGRVTVDRSWWQNDGVINTNSADGPTIYPTGAAPATIVPYSGVPRIGVYNYMGLWDHYDHFDLVGMPFFFSSVRNWYLNQAATLGALPN